MSSLESRAYRGYTIISDLGIEKYLFFRPADEESAVVTTIDFWKSKKWKVKDLYSSDDLSEFLCYWFKFIGDLATDGDSNIRCCDVRYWGCVCRELIDFMKDEDLSWEDIGISGELYIHLSIVADNYKYCVLMED